MARDRRSRVSRAALFGALAFLALAAPAGAATYYVRASGSDANTGLSPARAWASVKKAGDTLRAGDVVYVGAGTYTAKVDVKNSGSAAAPIRFLADRSGAFTGDAGAVVIATGGDVFKIDHRDHVRVSGFRVTRGGTGFTIRQAVGIVVEECEADANDRGFEIDDASVTITACDVHDNQKEGLQVKKKSAANLSDVIVRRNREEGIRGEDLDALTAQRCEIGSNGKEGVLLQKGASRFVNCLVHGNGGDGLRLDNPTATLTIWHATIAANGGDGVHVEKGTATVRNSILAGNGGAGLRNQENLVHSHDLLFGNAGGAYVGTAAGAGEIALDPLFVGGGDYHLQPTSPAIDAGTDASAVTREDRERRARPQGAGWDMGAYEAAPLVHHFVIVHDGYGIHCASELVIVRAVDAAGNPVRGYTGSIVLDTGVGLGTWASDAGNAGSFSDATPNDGRAAYTFAAADAGDAAFRLAYRQGPASLDLEVWQTDQATLRDDDTEGPLLWSASGYTVTASPLPNPPPDPILDPIPAQVAGTAFAVHVAAFGTTPSDPTCGVIEASDGPKNVLFWFTRDDPRSGPLAVSVDGAAIGDSEAAATPRPVTFTNGQTAVTARYDDVGRIRISMKEASPPDPNLPNGIRGQTNLFVVRPAGFRLSGIRRSADAFPNPGALDEAGPVFIAAGSPFTVSVEALDAEGDPTPSYGRESVPEGVRLAPTLVAGGAGANPPLEFTTGFGAFAGGAATGTDFAWPEVGILTVTPGVGDGDYLGAGDVVGTPSGNVGRFTPFEFDVAVDTEPVLATACPAGGFTYVGEPFSYATAPVLRVTALAAGGTATANYTGSWWKLSDASLGGPSYASDPAAPAALDASGLPAADPLILDLGGGDGTLTFGSGAGLRFVRSGAVAPFDAEIALAIDVVDSDGVAFAANPFRLRDPSPGNGIPFDAGKSQRYGRLVLENAFGSDLVDLPEPLHAEVWGNLGWSVHGDDVCTLVATAHVGTTARSPAPLATGANVANAPLLSGEAGLSWSAPGQEGWADVLVNLSAADVATPFGPIPGANRPWLRWDWSGDGAGPGFDENPSARITFGIFPGSNRVIFRREIY